MNFESGLKGLRKRVSRSQAGFTLIELLIVIAIIGILAAIAIPQFNQYKSRAYDSDTKSNLHNLYIACKAYWGDVGSAGSCTLAIAQVTTYGFIQSAAVDITATGTDFSWNATAFNLNTSHSYTINQGGDIGRI